MKVVDLKVLEKISRRGNKYKALFACLENGQEIFITFVR